MRSLSNCTPPTNEGYLSGGMYLIHVRKGDVSMKFNPDNTVWIELPPGLYKVYANTVLTYDSDSTAIIQHEFSFEQFKPEYIRHYNNQIADPAVGYDPAVFTADRTMKLLSLRFQMVTSVGVANRIIYLDISISGASYTIDIETEAASSDQIYCIDFEPRSADLQASSEGNNKYVNVGSLVLESGDTIQIKVTNIDAGDQLSNIVMSTVEV